MKENSEARNSRRLMQKQAQKTGGIAFHRIVGFDSVQDRNLVLLGINGVGAAGFTVRDAVRFGLGMIGSALRCLLLNLLRRRGEVVR